MSWGYLGKVPGRGDFLTHNVSPEFRDLFFEWCQAGLAVSRDQLGDDWLDAWLTAPIWHFCSAPGGIAEAGVVGTMIPSVDRVGRHFPFLALAEFNGVALDAWRRPDWAAAMEDCILAVLDDNWEEEPWRQRLASVDQPGSDATRLAWSPVEGNLVVPGGARERLAGCDAAAAGSFCRLVDAGIRFCGAFHTIDRWPAQGRPVRGDDGGSMAELRLAAGKA